MEPTPLERSPEEGVPRDWGSLHGARDRGEGRRVWGQVDRWAKGAAGLLGKDRWTQGQCHGCQVSVVWPGKSDRKRPPQQWLPRGHRGPTLPPTHMECRLGLSEGLLAGLGKTSWATQRAPPSLIARGLGPQARPLRQ